MGAEADNWPSEISAESRCKRPDELSDAIFHACNGMEEEAVRSPVIKSGP